MSVSDLFLSARMMSLVDAMGLNRSENIDLLRAILPVLNKMSPSEEEPARQFIRMKLDQVA